MNPEIPDYLPESLETKPTGRDAFTADELHLFGITMLAMSVLRECAQKYPGVACNLIASEEMGPLGLAQVIAFVEEMKKAGKLIEDTTGCEPTDLKPLGFDNTQEDE
tara:strand:- start:2665 stop:2985 length:321 start_codon:yes stop_codon:yes gene_type:complete